MGFTATTGSSADTLSGLINLLSDPKKVVAKLEELKTALSDHDASLQKVAEAQAELAQKQSAFKLEYDLIEADKAKLKKALEDQMKSTIEFDNRISEVGKLKREAEAFKKEAKEEKEKALEEIKAARAELENWRKSLLATKAEQDAYALALNQREAALDKKEASVKLMADEYQAKLNQLKTLVE